MSSRAKNIQKVRLKRGNVYHCNDGFFFKQNVLKCSTLYLKCIVESCPVRAKTQANLYGRIILSRPATHNHPPKPELIHVQKLKSEMFRRCEREQTSPRLIFQEEISKVSEETAAEFHEDSFITTMNKRKMYCHEPVTSLGDYVNTLYDPKYVLFSKTVEGGDFFQGLIKGHSLLFVSPTTKLLVTTPLRLHMN